MFPDRYTNPVGTGLDLSAPIPDKLPAWTGGVGGGGPHISEKNLSDFEVPKMLIFAKTDSHADDIIQIVREEFAEKQVLQKDNIPRQKTPKAPLPASGTVTIRALPLR